MKKMNNSRKKTYIYIICALAAGACLFFSSEIATGIRRGITLCGDSVIPSLFPFMIISTFVGSLEIAPSSKSILSKSAAKLFGLPSQAVSAAIMSFIGGYPAGLKLTEKLYSDSKVSHKTAKSMSAFCFNSGPAFVIASVGRDMFGGDVKGFILFVSLLASAIITGAVAARHKHNDECIKSALPLGKNINIADNIITSVSSAAETMFGICVWICVFCGIDAIFSRYTVNLPYYLTVFSEVTDGCMKCAKHGDLPLAAAVCAFGGLCVHLQILPSLRKTKIKYRYFLKYRLMHSILSYIICSALMTLPIAEKTSASYGNAVGIRGNAAEIILLCLLSAALVFDTAAKQKEAVDGITKTV